MRDLMMDVLIIVWAVALGLMSGMIYERYQRDFGALTVAMNAKPFANPLDCKPDGDGAVCDSDLDCEIKCPDDNEGAPFGYVEPTSWIAGTSGRPPKQHFPKVEKNLR